MPEHRPETTGTPPDSAPELWGLPVLVTVEELPPDAPAPGVPPAEPGGGTPVEPVAVPVPAPVPVPVEPVQEASV
ncbi:hypothetical protein [Streptomyces sp. NPDC059452]|uniref:hypothetical protein n=1 Tax=Streptomyces sp. NPDC059452 TaxID=3346835 RepID=UPI0036892AF8